MRSTEELNRYSWIIFCIPCALCRRRSCATSDTTKLDSEVESGTAYAYPEGSLSAIPAMSFMEILILICEFLSLIEWHQMDGYYLGCRIHHCIIYPCLLCEIIEWSFDVMWCTRRWEQMPQKVRQKTFYGRQFYLVDFLLLLISADGVIKWRTKSMCSKAMRSPEMIRSHYIVVQLKGRADVYPRNELIIMDRGCNRIMELCTWRKWNDGWGKEWHGRRMGHGNCRWGGSTEAEARVRVGMHRLGILCINSMSAKIVSKLRENWNIHWLKQYLSLKRKWEGLHRWLAWHKWSDRSPWQ